MGADYHDLWKLNSFRSHGIKHILKFVYNWYKLIHLDNHLKSETEKYQVYIALTTGRRQFDCFGSEWSINYWFIPLYIEILERKLGDGLVY